jgi:small multidrug resistance pump
VLIRLVLALAAAGCFVAGSMFMKPAAGFTNFWPSVAVFFFFGLAIVFDVHLVHSLGEIGSAVVLIGGLEATVAVLLARYLFDERLDAVKVLAITLVLAGVVLLEWRPGSDTAARHIGSSDRPSAAAGPHASRWIVQPAPELRAAGDAELRVHTLHVRVDRPT